MSEDVIKMLNEAEATLKAKEKELTLLQGKREGVMARLKQEFGVDTVDEAHDLLEQRSNEASELSAKIDEERKGLEELMEKINA